jgi:hypothetical protein
MCISKIFKHRCKYTKPIVSRYVSFNTRKIIYQCKCGKRKVIKVFSPNYPFPIQTATLITNKEFNNILNGGEVGYYQKFQKPFA